MSGIAQMISESERAQERTSWLERIELRCAAEWASCLPSPERIVATNEGEPPSDERDWRRAWIQVRGLRFGRETIFDYHVPDGSGR